MSTTRIELYLKTLLYNYLYFDFHIRDSERFKDIKIEKNRNKGHVKTEQRDRCIKCLYPKTITTPKKPVITFY